MNTAPHAAFADLSRPLASLLSHAESNRLATAWRHSLREVAERLRFIAQHRKTIAERHAMLAPGIRRHSPAYVAHARRQLAQHLPAYVDAVRRVSDCEQRMMAAGIRFALSSDAWDA
jgi:hypothetical protein